MYWKKTNRCHDDTRQLADRHYNRRSIGAKDFVPPGRCLVLLSLDKTAFWVTSWQYPEWVKHAWPGSWNCSAFRNEGSMLSSMLIRDAISCSRWYWKETPDEGMITFINSDKVKPKRQPGWCFLKAGFKHVGFTKGGLHVLHIDPQNMPEPKPPLDTLCKFL